MIGKKYVCEQILSQVNIDLTGLSSKLTLNTPIYGMSSRNPPVDGSHPLIQL